MKRTLEIASRALVQGNLSFRSQLENFLSNGAEESRDAIQAHGKWLSNSPIHQHMEEEEREWVSRDAGAWEPGLITDCFWKLASAEALLWVLGRCEEMSPYYALGDVNPLYKSILYPPSLEGFVDSCSIQPEPEIKKELEVYSFLNWRCRTEMLRLQGVAPPQGDTYEATVQRALSSLPTGSTAVEAGDSGLLIQGVPFSDFDPLGDVFSICHERHFALTWVLGDASWGETAANT